MIYRHLDGMIHRQDVQGGSWERLTREEADELLRAFDNPGRDLAAAKDQFTDYFVRNYPGPDTVIRDPFWHAPRIFRAAYYALAMRDGDNG